MRWLGLSEPQVGTREPGVPGRRALTGLGSRSRGRSRWRFASIASICGTVSDQRANFARSQWSRKSSSASRCSASRLSAAVDKIVQELFGGAMRGAHREAFLDEEAHDFRDREREGCALLRLRNWRAAQEFLERDFIRQLARAIYRAAAATRQSRGPPQRAHQRSKRPTETSPAMWIGGGYRGCLPPARRPEASSPAVRQPPRERPPARRWAPRGHSDRGNRTIRRLLPQARGGREVRREFS